MKDIDTSTWNFDQEMGKYSHNMIPIGKILKGIYQRLTEIVDIMEEDRQI